MKNLLLNTPPLTVYQQMALDEVVVKLRPADVTLRFYNWAYGPAVTYGYAQCYKEVQKTLSAACFEGICTRRPTGGGLVFHTDDLTFSLVFEHAGKPTEIYEKLHHCIYAQLARLGQKNLSLSGKVAKEVYQPSRHHTASACFINPVENDVLNADGQKILGGALRRFGTTVLYQGSLQVKDGRYDPRYKQALTNAVRSFLGVDLCLRAATPQMLFTAFELAQNQYENLLWKEKF